MKLIYCPGCNDLFRLYREDRKCKCGLSGGHYEANGRDAILWGQAIPFGLDNFELGRALQRRPEAGMGRAVSFFIIPKISGRITYQHQDSNWYWEQYQRTGRFEDMTRWLKHRAWENQAHDLIEIVESQGWYSPNYVRVGRIEVDPSKDDPGLTNPCIKPAGLNFDFFGPYDVRYTLAPFYLGRSGSDD